MVERAPLVLIDGRPSLLPSGDTVSGAPGGGGGATNLSYDAATRTVTSDTGTDAVLPLAGADAGLMSAADKTRLDDVESVAFAVTTISATPPASPAVGDFWIPI